MDETSAHATCHILPRSEHCISSSEISDYALKVLYRLHKAGYAAYLVGGSVRDMMLGHHPKDFDVATDALPEEIKALFKNCRLIGRRFRLAHIHFGRDFIEVATFRGHHDDANDETQSLMRDGMLVRDNVYGTLEEDASRRDFTVNALYYNIADFSIWDYADGVEHIRQKKLVLIGDVDTRLREDPVRMLRAIRFAAKLDFSIDPAMLDEIHEHVDRITNVPAARLFDDLLREPLRGIDPSVRELILVPDGSLHHLPFAAEGGAGIGRARP